MSVEIRTYFIRKHISYVATFIIIWTFFLASAYYHLYVNNKNDIQDAINVIYGQFYGIDFMSKKGADPPPDPKPDPEKAENLVD